MESVLVCPLRWVPFGIVCILRFGGWEGVLFGLNACKCVCVCDCE